jgi:acetylornithine deacetylase
VAAVQLSGRSLILNGHIDVVARRPATRWARNLFEPAVKDGWMLAAAPAT